MAENEIPIALPESLREQFDALERRLWRVETAAALCRGAAALAAAYLAFFVSERCWDTPVWIRALLLAFGLGGCAGAAALWRRRLARRHDLRFLASQAQKTHRRLGDRLLGIVELAGEQRRLPDFSPDLYNAAIAQVAQDALGCDFRASVDSRPAKRLAGAAAALGAMAAALCVLAPAAAANAFLRWAAPGSAIERYTLVAIEGVPGEIVAPHGEPFSLEGRVVYRSFWKPGRAKARAGTEPPVSAPIQSGQFRLQIPPRTNNTFLAVSVGDARHSIRIEPQYRPSLKELSAVIQLPDYLHYQIQTQSIRNGALLALEGSRVAFRGTISRPLAAAEMRDSSGAPAPLTIQGADFSTAAAEIAGPAQYSITWRDALGLTNAAPLRLAVQAEKDAPPACDLPDFPRETALLAGEVLDIRVLARDDYGVYDFGLMWEVFSDAPAGQSSITELKTVAESPTEKTSEMTFQWSPALFRIPADSIVELVAYARDRLPGRERVKSALCRIHVLSPEKHAEMIRQELEAAMERADEAARLQEKILSDTADIAGNAKLADAPKTARINQARDDQNRNAAALEQLARQGQDALREAMKNPMVPADALRQLANTMREWQKTARDSMRSASKSLDAAAKNGSSRSQDLAKAMDLERQALNDLKQQQAQNSDKMDQLQAMTFSQRLHRLGAFEIEAADSLLASVPDSFGLVADELPATAKDFEAAIVKGQETAQKDSETLIQELGRFVERAASRPANAKAPVPKTNYLQVCQEMKDARIAEEIDSIKEMISDNVTMRSSLTLTNWAGHFNAWAAKLEPPPSADSGSQNGNQPGGQQKNVDLGKQLVALLRLREEETGLRAQTRLLDGEKGTPSNYAEQAGAISKTQTQLSEQLSGVQKEIPIEDIRAAFPPALDAMSQAVALLREPQTGATTAAAQGASIDALSDLVNLINEQAQRPKPQQSQSQSQSQSEAEEMAFLTQMMKEQSNPVGQQAGMARAFNAGASGRAPAASPAGNAAGKAASQRAVDKAAGALESSPAEFREALDNYYRAIEP